MFLARAIQQDLYVVGAVGVGFGTSEVSVCVCEGVRVCVV